MPEYFYSCSDCPEHNIALNWNTGDIVDHCDHYDRNFTKSWPMRDTPCRYQLEIADIPCPICGETMDLYWSRKGSHFGCKVHGEPKESRESAPGVGDGSNPKKCLNLPTKRLLHAPKTLVDEEASKK
jgi:hypothetical protein